MVIGGRVEKSGRAFQADRVIWIKHRGRKDDMVRELSSLSWLEQKSINSGWFFLSRPQISLVITTPHVDR